MTRHQTLRVAIGWSHELCTPRERLLWSRLAIFPAGFDLDAAETVCADDRLPADSIFELLAQLVEKSIVYVESGVGAVRYRMLDSVREYGLEWIRELGEEPALRRRHRDRYLDLAARSEADWFGGDQAATFLRTELEHANLRAALEFSLATPGEIRTGLRLAGTLWFYWVGCGYLAEGRLWLDRALGLDHEPTEERAKALWVNGYVSILQGDNVTAVRMLRRCMAQAVETGDATALAYSIHRLGCAALLSDDHPGAAKLIQDALGRYDALGELNSNVLMAQVELAMATAFQGDLDQAEALCEETRRTCETHGELWSRAYALYVLSFARWARGEPRQAVELAKESLQTSYLFRDLVGCVLSVELLALYRTADASFEEAATLQGAAQRIWRVTGLRLFGSKYFNAPHEECEELARDALGDRGYDAAFRRGTEFGLDDAVAYALGAGPREPVPSR
jgi:tetratricopeptide (TPR) repeat protein